MRKTFSVGQTVFVEKPRRNRGLEGHMGKVLRVAKTKPENPDVYVSVDVGMLNESTREWFHADELRSVD